MIKKNKPTNLSSRIQSWAKPILLLSIIIILFSLAIVYNWGSALASLQLWIGQQGIFAPLVFLGIYLLVVLAAIPATPLGVAAGILFGSFTGVILVSIGSTVGATLAFLIARYFAHDAVEQWIQKRTKLQKIYELTQTHGFLIVAITRLIPLFPFNLLNYGLGLTNIPLKTYMFWSWICMLPGTIIVVVGSDVIIQALSTGTISFELIGIIITAVVILVLITWFTKNQILPKNEKKE